MFFKVLLVSFSLFRLGIARAPVIEFYISIKTNLRINLSYNRLI